MMYLVELCHLRHRQWLSLLQNLESDPCQRQHLQGSRLPSRVWSNTITILIHHTVICFTYRYPTIIIITVTVTTTTTTSWSSSASDMHVSNLRLNWIWDFKQKTLNNKERHSHINYSSSTYCKLLSHCYFLKATKLLISFFQSLLLITDNHVILSLFLTKKQQLVYSEDAQI